MGLENPTCKNLLASCNSQWCWKRCPPHTLQYILWNLSVVALCSLWESMGLQSCGPVLLSGVYGIWELWSHTPQLSLRYFTTVAPYSPVESMRLESCDSLILSSVYGIWEMWPYAPLWSLPDLRAIIIILLSGVYGTKGIITYQQYFK